MEQEEVTWANHVSPVLGIFETHQLCLCYQIKQCPGTGTGRQLPMLLNYSNSTNRSLLIQMQTEFKAVESSRDPLQETVCIQNIWGPTLFSNIAAGHSKVVSMPTTIPVC